jgi:hypothetical protein
LFGVPCAEEIDFLVELVGHEDFVWESGELKVEIVFYCTVFETGGFRESCPDVGEVFFQCVCEIRKRCCADMITEHKE